MAESPPVLAPSPVDEESLARAEKFTLEPFVHEGEDAAVVLAAGTPPRHALDDAPAEIDAGRRDPSVEWRRNYSLMLRLERLLAQGEPPPAHRTVLSAPPGDAPSGTRNSPLIPGPGRLPAQAEPHLADGTVLSAHQVDALSGTLIALLAEAQEAGRGTNGNGATSSNGSGNGRVEELPSGEVELEGDEELSDDDEPLDWDDAEAAEEEAAAEATSAADDPNAARRFWFEHATGAGKTVAALGFVEGSRTGGVLVLTHRRNPRHQVHGGRGG